MSANTSQRIEQPALWRFAWLIAMTVLAVAAAIQFDAWFYLNWAEAENHSGDWRRMFRVAGFLPVWVMLSLALVLVDGAGGRRLRFSSLRRGLLLCGSTVAGTLLAEVSKWLIGRSRPGDTTSEYAFQPWSERSLSTSDFGLPSSHSTVAFAAATALTHLFPRAAPVWYLFAAGCALARTANRAHYFSDVVAGAFVGILAGCLFARLMAKATARLNAAPPAASPPSAVGSGRAA